MIRANLSNSTEGGRKGRALTKWRRNGCARPNPDKNLQKPLRSKTSDRIYYRRCLPPKNPAGHREANRRIAKVHHSHRYPQKIRLSIIRGGST
jgi:hypothetical protein